MIILNLCSAATSSTIFGFSSSAMAVSGGGDECSKKLDSSLIRSSHDHVYTDRVSRSRWRQ